MSYHFEFGYDKRGYGPLILVNPLDYQELIYPARSGSLKEDSSFSYPPIDKGMWYIKDLPVTTYEENMHWTPGNGWKARLYRKDDQGAYVYTHYLIHPIRIGTEGCIGIIGNDAIPLKEKIVDLLKMQKEITVHVFR